MPSINTSTIFYEQKKQYDIEMYPDAFEYQFESEKAYKQYWSNLDTKAGFLYTDGKLVKRVPWYQYGWEQVKGWFGYINHCDAKKVAMNLQKILYFGYLFKFNTDLNLSQQLKSTLPEDYLAHSKQVKSKYISTFLQNDLVTSYLQMGKLPRYFGQTYLKALNDIDKNFKKVGAQIKQLLKIDTYLSTIDAQIDLNKNLEFKCSFLVNFLPDESKIKQAVMSHMTEKLAKEHEIELDNIMLNYPAIVKKFSEQLLAYYKKKNDLQKIITLLKILGLDEEQKVSILTDSLLKSSDDNINQFIQKNSDFLSPNPLIDGCFKKIYCTAISDPEEISSHSREATFVLNHCDAFIDNERLKQFVMFAMTIDIEIAIRLLERLYDHDKEAACLLAVSIDMKIAIRLLERLYDHDKEAACLLAVKINIKVAMRLLKRLYDHDAATACLLIEKNAALNENLIPNSPLAERHTQKLQQKYPELSTGYIFIHELHEAYKTMARLSATLTMTNAGVAEIHFKSLLDADKKEEAWDFYRKIDKKGLPVNWNPTDLKKLSMELTTTDLNSDETSPELSVAQNNERKLDIEQYERFLEESAFAIGTLIHQWAANQLLQQIEFVENSYAWVNKIGKNYPEMIKKHIAKLFKQYVHNLDDIDIICELSEYLTEAKERFEYFNQYILNTYSITMAPNPKLNEPRFDDWFETVYKTNNTPNAKKLILTYRNNYIKADKLHVFIPVALEMGETVIAMMLLVRLYQSNQDEALSLLDAHEALSNNLTPNTELALAYAYRLVSKKLIIEKNHFIFYTHRAINSDVAEQIIRLDPESINKYDDMAQYHLEKLLLNDNKVLDARDFYMARFKKDPSSKWNQGHLKKLATQLELFSNRMLEKTLKSSESAQEKQDNYWLILLMLNDASCIEQTQAGSKLLNKTAWLSLEGPLKMNEADYVFSQDEYRRAKFCMQLIDENPCEDNEQQIMRARYQRLENEYNQVSLKYEV